MSGALWFLLGLFLGGSIAGVGRTLGSQRPSRAYTPGTWRHRQASKRLLRKMKAPESAAAKLIRKLRE